MTTEGVRGLAEVLAEHRQEHEPSTGASHCACAGWSGPFTMWTGSGSYAEHIETAALAWFDARLGSGEVVDAVATAVTRGYYENPRAQVGDYADAPHLTRAAAAAVEAVRAALREGTA